MTDIKKYALVRKYHGGDFHLEEVTSGGEWMLVSDYEIMVAHAQKTNMESAAEIKRLTQSIENCSTEEGLCYEKDRAALKTRITALENAIDAIMNRAIIGDSARDMLEIIKVCRSVAPPCSHDSIKTVTTNAGMVYACEQCSEHWFKTYAEINTEKK